MATVEAMAAVAAAAAVAAVTAVDTMAAVASFLTKSKNSVNPSEAMETSRINGCESENKIVRLLVFHAY